MKISGKEIADTIKKQLRNEIAAFSKAHTVPSLAIITLGNESAWATYVKQKLKVAEGIGIKATHYNLANANEIELLQLIRKLNKDSKTHGIIVQRPLPAYIDKKTVTDAIDPQKDVDGFKDSSAFSVPVFLAVEKILEVIAKKNHKTIREFLKNKKIAVIGKGETAGMPSIIGLKVKYRIEPIVIDSKIGDAGSLLKNADIIISAVGKEIVNKSNIKKGVVLIGVGIRVEDGRAKGDYIQDEIENIASFYTPTPGGIGPLNLTFLFKNLLKAAKIQIAS